MKLIIHVPAVPVIRAIISPVALLIFQIAKQFFAGWVHIEPVNKILKYNFWIKYDFLPF